MAKRGGGKFLKSFMAGYDAAGKIMTDYEMAQIAKAKPETGVGFNNEQAARLHEAAKGDNDITVDDKGNYTITPKNSSVEAAAVDNAMPDGTTATPGATTINQGEQNRFMGKVYDKAPTEVEQDKARLMAMSGVLAKHGDPERAMRLRQSANQAELQGVQMEAAKQGIKLTEQGLRRGEREDARAVKEEAYQAGKSALYQRSIYAQVANENAAYTAARATYDKALEAAGTDQEKINALGAPPSKPTREYSMFDALHDKALGFAYDIEHGKSDMGKFAEFAAQMKQVKDEGMLDALRKAHAGVSGEELVAAFNATGKMRLDPKSIKSIVPGTVDLGGGAMVPTKIITITDENGRERTINTARELDSMGKAEALVSRAFEGKKFEQGERKITIDQQRADQSAKTESARVGLEGARVGIAARSETRAAAKDEREQAKLDAINKGVADLREAERTGDTEAARSARHTIIANGGRLDPVDTEIKITPNPTTGAQTVTRKDGSVGERDATGKITWTEGPAAASSAKAAKADVMARKPATEALAHEEARAAIKSGIPEDEVNARLKQVGYAPVPKATAPAKGPAGQPAAEKPKAKSPTGEKFGPLSPWAAVEKAVDAKDPAAVEYAENYLRTETFGGTMPDSLRKKLGKPRTD